MNGGIDDQVQQRVDAYRSKPQELQQSYAKNQQLIDLLALQKLKSEKDAMARQMQMQAQQNPQTIAQQREQEMMQRTKDEMVKQQAGVLQQRQQQAAKRQQQMLQGQPQPPQVQGIAGVPAPNMQKLASGGVVGFAAGGEPKDVDEMDSKEILELVTKRGVPAEDIWDMTNGKWVVVMENDRPVVKAGDRKAPGKEFSGLRETGRIVGGITDVVSDKADKLMGEENLVNQIGTALGSAAGWAATEGIPTFMEGFDPDSGKPDVVSPKLTTASPTPDATTPTTSVPAGIAPPDGNMVMQSSQNKPKKVDSGLGSLLSGTSATTSAPSSQSSYKPMSVEDILAIKDKSGAIPTFNMPEYNMPDLDAALSGAGQKGYDWYTEKAGRTPEVKERMQEMLANRQSTFDEANDPERQRERALINRLVAAGNSRTAGNMFGNMVRAGQRTEDIYDQNRQRALQNMQDFELANVINPDEAERREAAKSGLGMFGTQLGLEKEKSSADFESELAAEKARVEAALAERNGGLEAYLKSQELALKGEDVAARRTTNLIEANRDERQRLLATLDRMGKTLIDAAEAAGGMYTDQIETALIQLNSTDPEKVAKAQDQIAQFETLYSAALANNPEYMSARRRYDALEAELLSDAYTVNILEE